MTTTTFVGMTRVGSVMLPELPPDWPVAFDYETSGLYRDGDPGTKTQPAAPPAWPSALAIAWFDPETDELVSHAFPFDQGKVGGKPGRAVRDPKTGRQSFQTIAETLDFDNPNLEPIWYKALMQWLARRRYLVAHNAKFDMMVANMGLRADAGGFGGEQGIGAVELDTPDTYIYDTMVSQMLLAPLEMPSLKPTAKRLWGEDETEELEALKRGLKANGVGLGKRYDLVDWEVLGKYAAKDAELTIRLHRVQTEAEELEADIPPNYSQLLEDDLETMRVLYRMEKRGLPFLKDDGLEVAAELRSYATELAKRMPFDPSKLAQAIRFYYGWSCSVASGRLETDLQWMTSSHDWSRFFCGKDCTECQGANGLGLEPTSRTEKRGDPQLNQAEIDKLVKQNEPWAKEFSEYVACMSAIAKWYEGWSLRVGADGRLRPVFKQGKQQADRAGGRDGGTKTGRLAVERVQIQAVPRRTHLPIEAPHPKKLIQPREGKKLWESDLPAGEMRIVTVMSNCNAMWDILDTGGDMHSMVCEQTFGYPKDHPDHKLYRQVAKCIGFGTVFQSGPQTLCDQVYQQSGVKFKLQEMKDFIADFRGRFPEIQQLSDLAVAKADQWRGLGYVTLINGRNRWFEPHERVATCAMSSIIQGSLAETMKLAMRRVDKTYPGIMINQVHDSIWVEVDDSPEGEKLAWKVAALVQETFEETFDVRERPRMKFPVTPERLDLK